MHFYVNYTIFLERLCHEKYSGILGNYCDELAADSSYGHRAESILNHVFNKSYSNRVFPETKKLNYKDLNLWEKFSMY